MGALIFIVTLFGSVLIIAYHPPFVQRFLSSIDYQKYPIRDEASIRAFVQVFFSGAGLSPIVEHHNSKGRSDLEVKVGTRYWVFEFKVCKSTNGAKDLLNEAILQLQRKEYGLQEQEEQILRVALVFSLEKRKFTEFSQCD
ncbi:PD-(D/E)XK nuclease domain-containing protein [Parasutterella sp.]|uniref:PD-(D/E)XK nuclease domain-containing protein n=1 Tax=Parasutterella sp. TaxID=2049037 RepID=UPI003AF0D77E